MVKNLPAMWETWVLFLGWEDPLEKGKAAHSSILAWNMYIKRIYIYVQLSHFAIQQKINTVNQLCFNKF